jgi:hypothetical protein
VTEDGGDKYTITRITPTKTVAFTFRLGEPVTADPLGADQPTQVTHPRGQCYIFKKYLRLNKLYKT